MPVVINELEVIAEPEPPEPRREMRRPTPPSGPTPEDVYWVMRRLALRRWRLQAD
jgi:hypothetical protein